jgi:hypothetical protein
MFSSQSLEQVRRATRKQFLLKRNVNTTGTPKPEYHFGAKGTSDLLTSAEGNQV